MSDENDRVRIDFTVKTALQFAKSNNINEWITQYLTYSDGPNIELLRCANERIRKHKGYWEGPIEVQVSSLVRCFSPNPDKVSKLVQNIADPYSVAPLLIHSRIHNKTITAPYYHTNFHHKLEIADGNHRHAAFEKLEWKTCWVLIEFGTEHEE